MAARTLSQIVAELDPTYTPQIESIRQRQAAIPEQMQAEEKGLQAKQENAFGDILNGARRRGLGFSGIPLAEQAKYTASEYMPALARLRQSGNEQRMSLEDAILGIQERRNTLAQTLWQQEKDREEQQRQFEQQMAESRRQAAAASSFSPSFGGGPVPTDTGGGKLARTQRPDGGFAFTLNGQPISAATYSRLAGIPFRDLVSNMAKSGDKGAAAVLGAIGNDYGYNPNKINSSTLANIYNSLVWGSGRSASYSAPKPQSRPNNLLNNMRAGGVIQYGRPA